VGATIRSLIRGKIPKKTYFMRICMKSSFLGYKTIADTKNMNYSHFDFEFRKLEFCCVSVYKLR
jgi:hypothetical protein